MSRFEENVLVSSVLMAIIANDLTLGYFNFTNGLPKTLPSDVSSMNAIESPIQNETIKEINENDWNMDANWD